MRAPIKKQSLSLLRERGVPVATVLDVGVRHCTPELMNCWPDVPHVLFEPLEAFRTVIAECYGGIPHKIVTAAVSDRVGETEVYAAHLIAGEGISHAWIARPAERSKDNAIVPMITLDHYLAENPAPGPYFLKIDVDGVEADVLRGAPRTLAACSIVMVEASFDTLTERASIVEAAGFRLFDLTEPCYYDGALHAVDAIFVAKGLFEDRFRFLPGPFDPRFGTVEVEPSLYQAFDGN